MIVEKNNRKIDPWWKMKDWLDEYPRRDYSSMDIKRTLDKSVHRQLMSDVPVGIFLSGGLDSSSIAASAVHSGGRDLKSFSSGFDYDKGIL